MKLIEKRKINKNNENFMKNNNNNHVEQEHAVNLSKEEFNLKIFNSTFKKKLNMTVNLSFKMIC